MAGIQGLGAGTRLFATFAALRLIPVLVLGVGLGDAAIVRSVIDLGHNLAMNVVAEGVEDEDAVRSLLELGCDITQGYWFSRPLPADQISP